MFKITEQRKYVRIEKPYFTRFQVKSNECVTSGNWNMVPVINLSAGGLFFYPRMDLEVDKILDFKIGFSRVHPTAICVGRVIRAKRLRNTSIIGFAIEFTEIDEQIKKTLNNTIKIVK